MKLLVYDGQGFWLCHKRLSMGHFLRWPAADSAHSAATALRAHELAVLLAGGDPRATAAAPEWRRVAPRGVKEEARRGGTAPTVADG